MSRRDHERPVHVGTAWRVILRDLGLDAFSVLRRAGLSPTLFEGEGSYISVAELYSLHEAVALETGDPLLALKGGRVVALELFDPALFAAICSPDMNVAATRLGQFKRLVGAFSLDVNIESKQTRLRYRCKRRPDIPLTLGLSELVFLVAFARRATREHIRARAVRVQRMPRDVGPYEEFFGCALSEADEWSVSLDAADAALPFLTHNVQMWETFEPTLRRRMAEADEERSASDQVEAALFELLPSGRAQMKEVAKELGVGARTLQRRLAAEETSWLEVLNRTRERLARHYLKSTRMSAAEVSFLLGFEDPNSLFRAFQRWTGTTPETWRAEVGATE